MQLSQERLKVLVVDDEAEIRGGLSDALKSAGYDVASAESGEQAVYELRKSNDIGFVVADYKMPGLNGFDVLKEAKKISVELPVVIMTGHGSVNHAVEAMQSGADDYLCKPFRFQDLEKIIIKKAPRAQEARDIDTDEIITEDENFRGMLEKARKAAASNVPVLIEGPSGTGKELLARQIHLWSNRSKEPWVALNCAALPAGLLESELFGFEKGSFTGAHEKRIGKFEQANGGTLLLDEIGELDPILQAKLLRVLQEDEIDRIGSRKPQRIDVRIIATTNRNLAELVRKGKFREDLFFRLYGVRFEMPSLNQRPGDIPVLAAEFLNRQSQLHHQPYQFNDGVLSALQQRVWSGNIRELERAVERAAILSTGNIVRLEDFEFEATETAPRFQSFSSSSEEAASRTIKELERESILGALAAHQGNRTHTAKALGMSLRTLRHKLKQYREEGLMIEPARQGLAGRACRVAEIDASLSAEF